MKSLTCLLAIVAFSAFAYAEPEIVVPATVSNGYHVIPNYKSSYAVTDVLTGDRKTVQEARTGDLTKGSYSFVRPDGVVQTTIYTSSPVTGYQSQVINSGPTIHPKKATSIAIFVNNPLIPAVLSAPSPVPVVVPSPAPIVASPLDVVVPSLAPFVASPVDVVVPSLSPVVAVAPRVNTVAGANPVLARLSSSNLAAVTAPYPGRPHSSPVSGPVAARFATSNLAIGDPRVAAY